MATQLLFAEVDQEILQRLALNEWDKAERASWARHAERANQNWEAAREFGRLKIAAIQRAAFLVPQYFGAEVHRVKARAHFSVKCIINERRLHVPTWVKLPDAVFRSHEFSAVG